MPLNVLVVDRSPPTDARQGNALIAIEVMRRLAHHRLVLVAPGAEDEPDLAALRDVYSEVHVTPRRAWTPAITGSLEAPLRRLPALPRMDLAAARALAATVTTVAQRVRFDVVHVRQLPMAAYGRLAPSRGKLLELVDSETLGAERARPRSPRAIARAMAAAQIERRAVDGFDVITTVAAADARRVQALRPDRRVEVVPNGVDGDRFRRPVGHRPTDATLVFVGAMSFGPNVAAMEWFCANVLPAVRARVPDARLSIVGRDPTPAVRRLADRPGVVVTGEVDDVRPFLADASVFVAPMISGSGIKNKVLEAMAMGLPVVATPLGVEGLDVTAGRDLLVANSAPSMAESIVGLLGDHWARELLGESARATVERAYTWEVTAAMYERLWHEIGGRQ